MKKLLLIMIPIVWALIGFSQTELPGTIQAEDYVGYYDTSPGNIGNIYRFDDVDVATCPDISGGYEVGWTDVGEWLTYNVKVKTSGTYNITFRGSAWAAVGAQLIYELNHVKVTHNIAMIALDGHHVYGSDVLQNVILYKGINTFKITIAKSSINLNWFKFDLVDSTSVDPNAAPVVDAGINNEIIFPANISSLDGTNSFDMNGKSLSYEWTEVSGPSQATITNPTSAKTDATNLLPGKYVFQLTCSNGSKTATDQMEVKVLAGIPRNIALKKLANSSTINGTNVAANAVDSVAGSRWESQFVSPSWIRIDLGKRYDIDKVVLKWEAANAESYKILISDIDENPNPDTWTVLSNQTGMPNKARTDSMKGLSGSGRYIAMYATNKVQNYGYSLYEFEVYGELSAITEINNVSNEELKIYPNPTTANLEVEYSANAIYKILSLDGSVITTNNLTAGKTIITTDYLAQGIYFISIIDKNRCITSKFIKE